MSQTGTAIWLIDLACEHPTAQIDSFHIDLSQAPPKRWLSPNITLKTWEVLGHPSEDMIEDYDVVHVRLLVLVVQESDTRNIIRNLLRMLKQGGYIRWDELHCPDTYIRNSDSSLLTLAFHELRAMVHPQGRNDWTLRLPELVAKEDLLDVNIYHFQAPPELAKGEWRVAFVDDGIIRIRPAKTDCKDEETKIFKLLQDVSDEVLDDATLSMPR